MLSPTNCLVAALLLAFLDVSEGLIDICMDNVDNCEGYSQQDCVTFKVFAVKDCPKSCGFCTRPTMAPYSSSCPPGWKHYFGDETCLVTIGGDELSHRLDWFSARRYCQNLFEGDLVVIKDVYKNAFVRGMTPQKAKVWIGLRNVGVNANTFQFEFVDKESPTDYHPWQPNNPDNYNGKERCVTLEKNTFGRGFLDGQWNDLDCNAVNPFVCQKPAKVFTAG